MRLDGKVALITGAGQGIGKAVALRLARDGAGIVVADMNGETARATAEEIAGLGRKSLAVQVDVSNVTQQQAMVDAAVRELGRIDILVACAGIAQVKNVLDITETDWDRVMSVNVKGLFFTNQLVARQMIAAGNGGAIVNIASIAGYGGRAVFPHYAASKASVLSITRSVAAALAKDGITVNAVCPGIVDTAMWDVLDREMSEQYGTERGEYFRGRVRQIPLKRVQTPEDVANAISFLVSPDAAYITGEAVNVDGGLMMN